MTSGTENTRIYTVFVSSGYGGAGAAPKSFTTNEDLVHALQRECPGASFIVRDMTSSDISFEKVYSELESSKDNLDGVLIIGSSRDYRLAFTGLPTIVVYNLFEWMLIPYKLYATGEEEHSVLVGGPDYKDGRILTAELDRRNVCSPSKREAMFEDLVYKVGLIQALKKLKSSRILVVAPQHYLAEVDYQGDRFKHLSQDYNERYTQALKDSLGVELVRVEPEAFYTAYEATDGGEAESIAETWMAGAEAVTAAKSEIVRTARAYLAFEALRERFDCNAVSTHMRTLSDSGRTEDRFWPGLALECGFKMRGIQAVCQNYPNILVTQLLGYFLTGRPSMLGDIMIDRHNSVDILTHCGAPINPYGDERRVSYRIATHAESPVRDTQEPGSSTGLHVEWPVGEPVTVWKAYVLNRKIGLHTGITVDGHDLYKNLDEIMCRSKIVVRVENIEAVQNHQSPDAYGIHRAATLGDLRGTVKDVATLMGFDVMEEDV
ncbi:MAG: hypothetical protein ACP5JG_17475 [Anaerolineae bacterium]